jgi:hypothetical protein
MVAILWAFSEAVLSLLLAGRRKGEQPRGDGVCADRACRPHHAHLPRVLALLDQCLVE